MFDVFVGEPFALRTLRQADAFAETSIISFAVCRVQRWHGRRAGYADGH